MRPRSPSTPNRGEYDPRSQGTDTMIFDPLTLTLAQEDSGTGDTTSTSQADGGAGDTPAKEPSGGLFGNPMFMVLMIGMLVFWVFLIGGGSRKQKKKQAELLATMTKGSKVITIGGIKGSVIEVRDDEVLVKVDESANTRLRFSKDAIRTVTDGSGASDDSK